jgi:Na+/H+ antiporter NhaC
MTPITYGFLSVIPPILAIVLAIYTRQVYIALSCGIWSGYLIITHFHPLQASTMTIGAFVDVFADADNTRTIMFTALMGGLMLFIQKSGGVKGFIEWVAGFTTKLVNRGLNSRKIIEMLAFITGVSIFIESTINTLTVGTVFRPVFDKLNIPREKLAYIAHSCSAPVCMLIPLNAWGAYVIGLLNAQHFTHASDIFIHCWMYNFYPMIALLMVIFIILSGKNFGPMKTAEERVKKTGELLRLGAVPFGNYDEGALELKPNITPRAINMLLPIIVLVLMMPIGLMATGWDAVNITDSFLQKLFTALTHGSGATAVLYAISTSLFSSSLLYLSQRLFSFTEIVNMILKGISDLITLALLMMLAFAIGKVCRTLGTGFYVAQITQLWLHPAILPAVLFFVACLMAFAMGTAWGTFAIMLPIAIPLAQALCPNHAELLYMSIAASLGGGVFGNHCSPIADTTLITALGSGNDPIDHVKTQLPYAVTAAVLTGALYLIFAWTCFAQG